MISTKIVATIGPASDSVEKLKSMYENGMRIARLNFSHGTHEYFIKVIRNIRTVSDEIAILLDTKGPEIRIGDVENGEITLSNNDKLVLTNKKCLSNNKKLYIDYNFISDLKKGDIMLIDDGLIEAIIEKSTQKQTIIRILNGGKLRSKKSVILKGHNPQIKFLSKKDKSDIEFGIKHNVDFIAASYVREKKDVQEILKILNKHNSDIKLISKIEHWKSVDNLDEIINVSDGIMVARGDLGIELPMERIPKIQLQIVKKCNRVGKPVIVATQMLESMKDNSIPTRAEVSDVAQAILQGSDAIMLSGETASGKYPIKSVEMMQKIAREYDSQVSLTFTDEEVSDYKKPVSNFVTKAAYLASEELKAKAIIAPTESGFTARKVSRFKPMCPIYSPTRNKTVLRQLQLSWGVIPIHLDNKIKKHENIRFNIISDLYKNKKVSLNDCIVITSGNRIGVKGHTNLVEIYKVKDILK